MSEKNSLEITKKLVAVIGGHSADNKTLELAYEVGKRIALSGAALVTGGLAGVMEAASKGAYEAGGITVGIIPGEDKSEANPYVNIVIPTGIGYSRNTLVAGGADMVIALSGKYGTLSEIGFALNAKKKVYGFNTWDIPGVIQLSDLQQLEGALRDHGKSN